ncbi:MAG: thioredoxin family protein [Phycisphaerae bacterium]
MKSRVRVSRCVLFILFAATLGTAQNTTTSAPASQPAARHHKKTPTTKPAVTTVPQRARSLDQAITMAKATNKDIYLVFTAKWCGYCRKFEKEVLSTPEAKKALAKVIFLRLNFDTNKAFARKYQIDGIPAGVLLKLENKKLKVVDKHIGALTKSQFVHFFDRVKK